MHLFHCGEPLEETSIPSFSFFSGKTPVKCFVLLVIFSFSCFFELVERKIYRTPFFLKEQHVKTMDFLAIAQTHHEIRGPSEAGVMKLIDHLDDGVELNVSGGALRRT